MRLVAACALFLALNAANASAQNPAPKEQQAAPLAQVTVADTAPPARMDAAKEADIRRMMELNGTADLVAQVMSNTESSIRPLLLHSFPPGEYREKLIDLFFAKFHSKASSQDLLNLAVPVYDKHFSGEEIKGLIQFYETPLGKKLCSALPALTADLQAAGGNWGREMGRQSMLEVLAEHPDLARALEDAKSSGFPK